jgi:BRCT domain type II-containing protein
VEVESESAHRIKGNVRYASNEDDVHPQRMCRKEIADLWESESVTEHRRMRFPADRRARSSESTSSPRQSRQKKVARNDGDEQKIIMRE